MVLETSTTEGTLLVVSIFDTSGKLLHEENTRASRVHRWSVEWASNSKIIIQSSDIGPIALMRGDDGKWSRVNPLRALSPDGKHVASVHWNSYREKFMTLSILEANGDVDAASSIIKRFETQIVVSNLDFCARWEGDQKIIVKADSSEHVWLKSPDGEWGQKDK